MDISIITPSFNMLSYLKRARASVADQQGVGVEHIVADGGSSDGTVAWLAEQATEFSAPARPGADGSTFRYFSGKDNGMYDALNKGFERASGEVVAWLNCDEQYLEGTLAHVTEQFRRHPEVDILFGGALLVDPNGGLLAARRAYPARRLYIATSHLYNLSCATFFRRSVWQQGLRFDTSYRNLGDHDLILRALASGHRSMVVKRHLSVFSFTGSNLSWTEGARRESARLHAEQPAWVRMARLPLNAARLAEKVLHGGYGQRPFDYAVYTNDGKGQRHRFHVDKASVRWPDSK
jgi:glycosyltransferase involved in cell wall biosynthesis